MLWQRRQPALRGLEEKPAVWVQVPAVEEHAVDIAQLEVPIFVTRRLLQDDRCSRVRERGGIRL